MSDQPPLPTTARGIDALAVADGIAREAGALVAQAARSGTDGRRTASLKSRRSWVTEADRASEKLILQRLAEAFPGHAVLAEESRPDTGWERGYVWVIDPLDGTRNFVSAIPIFCVNVALLLDGEALLGATYDPNRDVCVLGGPGLGLTANGEPASASAAPDLASAIVTTDLGFDDRRGELMLDVLSELWPEVQGCRIIGSAAIGLAWAACGQTDLMLHPLLCPWDVAAALALVPAGGGLILDRDGGPATPGSEGVAAGAPAVVHEFLQRFEGRPWR